MATSGSISFTMNARKVIDKAFGKIGVKAAEQPLEDIELQDGMDALNLMIKAWGAQGLHLWAKDEAVLFLDIGKAEYSISESGDKACLLSDLTTTTTSAPNIATDVIVSLTSSANMSVGGYIGIELDDNTRFWSTVLTVDSSTQVTLSTQLPSAAKTGNTVVFFDSLLQRPNRILSYRRKTIGEDNEIPVNSWSREQYFNQVNKLSSGTVVNCYYSPQTTNGKLYVWQTVSSVNDYLRFTFERQLQDISTANDDLDFPSEWLEAIIYGLAFRLCDDYNVPLAKADRIGQKANNYLDDLLGWDEEMESLNLQPDFS